MGPEVAGMTYAPNPLATDGFMAPAESVTLQERGSGAAASQGRRGRGAPGAATAPPAKRAPGGRQAGAPKKKPRTAQDAVPRDDDGLFTHNRAGVEICRSFNAGRCELATWDMRYRSYRCPKEPTRVHQCSGCLSDGHAAGSAGCTNSSKKGKGGGKGSGKGKGRGGK